jgi:hypothetical protein
LTWIATSANWLTETMFTLVMVDMIVFAEHASYTVGPGPLEVTLVTESMVVMTETVEVDVTCVTDVTILVTLAPRGG